MPRPRARIRLRDVDVDAVIAGYEDGTRVDDLCASHGIGLSRLYRVLDDHHVARRKPSRPRISPEVQQAIVACYTEGEPIHTIAARYGISTSSVSDIARRYWRHRAPKRHHDELVALIVAWTMGERLSSDDRVALTRVGVATAKQGLAALEHVDDHLRRAVAEQLVTLIRTRWLPASDHVDRDS